MYSHLLSKREIDLFNKLHNRKVRDAETFNHEDYQGIKTSVVDKYPESAHFVYELLQNADDAFATYAEFMLFDDGLIFKHNGTIPFSISDEGEKPLGHINSITSIGNSSKRDNYNKIGKFGVGFKSVFTYTDVPEIYDDKFWFKIENLIVPCWLDKDNKYRNEGETLFYIPFKNINKHHQEILDRLNNLDNPIAFLSNLRSIVWKRIDKFAHITDEKSYTKEVIEERKLEDYLFRKTILRKPGDKIVYLFFTSQILYSESSFDVTVGYKYDDDNKELVLNNSGDVYCFFPTKENFRTAFISHAPFILVDNRQNLKQNEEFNYKLINIISKLAANALVFIRDYGIEIGYNLINENIMKLFPFELSEKRYSWESETFDTIIKKEFKEVFKNEKLFLSNDRSTYVGINDAYICTPVTILDYFNDSHIKDLGLSGNAPCFLTKELCNNKEFKERLTSVFGIQELKSEIIAIKITKEFMEKQSLEWVFKLYQFLINEAPKLWKTDTTTKNKRLPFKYAPIILNHKNEWIAPYIDENTYNVYLNIGTTEGEYNFVSDKIMSDKRGERFIKELGIKEPDKLSYIKTSILPQYQSEDIQIDDEDCLKHFSIIFDYYKTLSGNDQQSFVELLRTSYKLVNNNKILKHPKDLYIYSEELSNYFGDIAWEYVDNKFYYNIIEKYSSNEFSEFLHSLGCSQKPRLINVNHDGEHKLYCNRVTRYSRIENMENYIIDSIEKKLNTDGFSLKDSLYIWSLLCNIERDKIVNQHIYYKKRSDGHTYPLTIDSDMCMLIKTKKWLFNSNGDRCDVSNIFVEDIDAVGYKYDKNLIEILGIKRKCTPLENYEGITKEQIDNERRGRIFKSDADAEEAYALLMEKRKSEERQKTELKTSSDIFYQRKEQTKTNFDNMFSQQEKTKLQKANQNKKEETYEEKLKELETEIQKKQELEELRVSIEKKEKYSFGWFNSLLALEFNNTSIDSKEELRKSLSLEFGSITKDPKSERVLILSNPSRYIPLWLEEMGSIEVNFVFKDKEDIRFEFEVSDVREFKLLLKVKTNDIDRIKEIDWDNCIKATINKNNPIELIGKLQTAFKNLNFEDEYSLKQNLPENIQFLFGPPGTGKTTTLSKKIADLIKNSEQCKILVLTPTNKACDVLCKKIIQDVNNTDVSWLGRFVATGDETIEASGLLIDRESNLYTYDKCCVVSTIARLPYDGFKHNKLMDIEWDYVIFDESSMISLAYIIFAIYKFEGSKFIVSGDPFQISPIVNEKLWEKENIYTMVNLDRFHNPETEPHNFEIVNLDTQYRSIPSIGELFSRYTYDGKLKHHRKEDSQRCISIDGIPLKPINYITFHVDFYNSIFSPKKLSSSNIHIYSVLFVIEFCRHLIKSVPLGDRIFKVGIICPYVAEAQMIEKLLEQIIDVPEHFSFMVGTIHSFQGDECNMILAVFNPPRMANDISFINRKNIINVAISRAEDYLCILMPDIDTKGYENYYELNNLGIKAIEIQKEYEAIMNYTCDELEKVIFGKSFTIENNTFITGHQMANVYSKPTKRYEFRIDDAAADIQFNDEIDFV